MRLLVHVTNYDELRRLIMGTNLRSELNKVYYRGKYIRANNYLH